MAVPPVFIDSWVKAYNCFLYQLLPNNWLTLLFHQKFPRDTSCWSENPPINTRHERAVTVNTLAVIVTQLIVPATATISWEKPSRERWQRDKVEPTVVNRANQKARRKIKELLNPLRRQTKTHTSKINESNIAPRDTQTNVMSLWLCTGKLA